MMPAETSLWVGNKIEHGLVKRPVTTVASYVLKINLRGNNDEHSKHEWYE